ncbi:hypothetical protein [Ottowia sp.]|uniref:hypothetical protein n=1 Tax=Ottowia sp. TaxID=1898956 RepID=UPI0025FA1BD1|nr:hypothetical protein [Ottowia sp.]MBK6616709.1 hypothetical protein [Ottowia sp.]
MAPIATAQATAPAVPVAPTPPSAAVWRSWNHKVISILVVAALALPLVNLVVDPFDLFMVTPMGTGPYTNQRLHHVRYLSAGRQAPDVLVLGDSIMGINDPGSLAAATQLSSAYNASVFMASASDIRDMARFVATLPSKPKLIVVGLDTYMFSGQARPDSFSIKMPPQISGDAPIQWWTQALFAPTFSQSFDKVVEKMSGSPTARYNFETGHYSRPRTDRELSENPDAFSKRVFSGVASAATPDARIPVSARQLTAISEAAAILANAGVKTAWVLQPPSHGLKLLYRQSEIDDNVRAILSHLPGQTIVDLSNMASLTDDPRAWYDLKHYTAAAGKSLLAEVGRRLKLPS